MTAWNWDPAEVAFLDFETQSAANLRDVGASIYLADPSTRILSCVFLRENALTVWIPTGRAPEGVDSTNLWPEGFERAGRAVTLTVSPQPPEVMLCAIRDGVTFVAHNAAGFDAECWARHVGDPQPTWCDTIPSARAAGLPGGLDALGKRFLNKGKDEAGARALKLLYTAKSDKKGGYVYNVGTKALWESMLRYNLQDVLLLEKVWSHIRDYGEADVMAVDGVINTRGIAVDRPYLQHLTELWSQLQRAATEHVSELTDGEIGERNIRSVPQMRAYLKRHGLDVSTLNRKSLEALYEDPEEFFEGDVPPTAEIERLLAILRDRQTATRISTGKIDRVLRSTDDDGRIRNLLVYHGAHTGRWTGRNFQPHNLAKGLNKFPVPEAMTEWERGGLTLEWVRSKLREGEFADDALSTLFRPALLAAPGCLLAIIDYASVEARGIAWIAGQEDLLSRFAEDADVYSELASKIFARPINKNDHPDERQIGKISVLGCGYGMGDRKFAMFCELSRVDLREAGTTAKACVQAYRDAYSRIAGPSGVWKTLEGAAFAAVRGKGSQLAGKCELRFREGRLEIVLPSGRPLIYRDARIEPRIPGWAVAMGIAARPQPTLVYTHPRGYEKTLYGGLIAENVVQALCRDLMATALVRAEGEGIPVVLHVHDEIVAELPTGVASKRLKRLAAIMSEPPDWAEGFPVGVEGYLAPRYAKGKWPGMPTVKAVNGVATLEGV